MDRKSIVQMLRLSLELDVPDTCRNFLSSANGTRAHFCSHIVSYNRRSLGSVRNHQNLLHVSFSSRYFRKTFSLKKTAVTKVQGYSTANARGKVRPRCERIGSAKASCLDDTHAHRSLRAPSTGSPEPLLVLLWIEADRALELPPQARGSQGLGQILDTFEQQVPTALDWTRLVAPELLAWLGGRLLSALAARGESQPHVRARDFSSDQGAKPSRDEVLRYHRPRALITRTAGAQPQPRGRTHPNLHQK